VYGDDVTEFDIDTSVTGDVARITLSGDLDLNSCPRLLNAIREIARPPLRAIRLDCRGVTFLDSAGVRALIVSRNEATRTGIDVVVVEPSGPVVRVIEMTGLTGLLTIAPC
jgi:anti-sigma B factor antagonist